jgi:hypothetical protein
MVHWLNQKNYVCDIVTILLKWYEVTENDILIKSDFPKIDSWQ